MNMHMIKPIKGRNARTTVTERRKDEPSVAEANELMRRSGRAIKPAPNAEYVGSACVHYYRESNLGNEHTFHFGVITLLDGLEEGNADLGLKHLRTRMMQFYGRTN